MRLLVTGTDGYIGCRLAPMLIGAGHTVTGLDTGYYRDGWLYSTRETRQTPLTLNMDLRDITASDLAGYDGVVHLAELSNDPLGQNNPEVTERINYEGSVRLAQAARSAGVRRFVYASSCSIYGQAVTEWVDESSTPNPQTVYARCKALVEGAVRPMASPEFCVTFLRNATAYGASPRIRFDIVINDLCALAWTTKRIAMISDGTPWRPFVHIEDISQAILCVLGAPAERVNGEILNVGSDEENYRMRDIAQIIAETFEGCTISTGASSGDRRSYRVSFKRIRERLPEFRPRWTARRGAEELRELFQRIELSKETYEFRGFTRLKQLNYLKRTAQVDEDLRWRY